MARKSKNLAKYDSENSMKYSKSDSKSKNLENEIFDLECKLKDVVNIIEQLCECVRALNTQHVKLTDVDEFLKKAEEFVRNNK